MTSPSNNRDFEEERDLRTNIHIALDLALNSVLDDYNREITAVEEEKLTYFAIKEFDLDLTYSWYLAGTNTMVGSSPVTKSSMNKQFGSATPNTPLTDELSKLRRFFKTETFFDDYTLSSVWFTNKFDFLHDFYESYAPEPYRDLYLASIELREKLWNVDELLHTEFTNATLGDFGGGGNNAMLDPTDEEEIRYIVSDLHLELAGQSELSPTVEAVSAGTDLIEQVLYHLTTLESTTKEQRRVLSELHDFYYYYVWRYPALATSVKTADGPHAESLRQDHILKFDSFEDELVDELEKVTDWCYQTNLLPNTDTLSSGDSSSEKYFQTLARDVIDS